MQLPDKAFLDRDEESGIRTHVRLCDETRPITRDPWLSGREVAWAELGYLLKTGQLEVEGKQSKIWGSMNPLHSPAFIPIRDYLKTISTSVAKIVNETIEDKDDPDEQLPNRD